ncbi:MAG: exo-alpha-sialidase [Solirubrobacteraceae bacterium]
MHVFTWRRALVLGAVAVLTGCVVAIASGGSSVSTARTLKLTKLQRRILSGFASFELGQTAGNEASARTRATNFTPISNPAAAACPTHHGSDVKVNQNCLNVTDSDLQGRGQAENETSMAVNPRTGQLVATYNDYRRGDSTCGPSFSSGGTRWLDSTLPNNFVRGTAFGGVAREYFQSSGDPTTALDTKGNAYFGCLMFQRGLSGVTNNPDNSSGIYMYRSTATGGASWNFPGRPVVQQFTKNASGLPLLDKEYMTVDTGASSRFKDRVYVTWTFFDSNGTANIYEAHSTDFGETFSSPVLVSGKSAKLCPKGISGADTCDNNQNSEPFTAPNGTLYVVFDNFNNVTSGKKDNHRQVLIAKSTNGGSSFGSPVKVADYYDLPDCATYQGGQDPGQACVPEKGKSTNSVFRADNYPAAGVNPTKPNQIVVTFGSYINRDSNERNGCRPEGVASDLQNLYDGVKTPGACNNKILYSVSTNGGASFTGTNTDPRKLPVVPQRAGQKRTDQFWQWAAFSPSGKLGVSYYDRQYGNDETTGSSDVSLSASSSLNGFATVRVTSSSMPSPTQFPDTQGNSEFYGDYSGLAVRGNTAYPLWMDTRDPDLFLCPGTGTAGHPPRLCTGTSGSAGRQANDENVYTRAVALP